MESNPKEEKPMAEKKNVAKAVAGKKKGLKGGKKLTSTKLMFNPQPDPP